MGGGRKYSYLVQQDQSRTERYMTQGCRGIYKYINIYIYIHPVEPGGYDGRIYRTVRTTSPLCRRRSNGKRRACEFWKQHLGKNVVDLPILESSRSISILQFEERRESAGKKTRGKYENPQAPVVAALNGDLAIARLFFTHQGGKHKV